MQVVCEETTITTERRLLACRSMQRQEDGIVVVMKSKSVVNMKHSTRSDRRPGRKGQERSLGDDAPDELMIVDLPVPTHKTCEPANFTGHQHRRRPTHTVATPFKSSSTSASDIFSPN